MSYANQWAAWMRGAFDGVIRSPAPEPNGSHYYRKMAMIDPHGLLDAGE